MAETPAPAGDPGWGPSQDGWPLPVAGQARTFGKGSEIQTLIGLGDWQAGLAVNRGRAT